MLDQEGVSVMALAVPAVFCGLLWLLALGLGVMSVAEARAIGSRGWTVWCVFCTVLFARAWS
jgi:hypothetical protein